MTRQAMLEAVLFVVLVLDAVANGVSTRSAASCPSFCTCDTWYELHRVSCTGRHLYSIHTGAPSDVQAMDVSNNSISELNDRELAVSSEHDACALAVITFFGYRAETALEASGIPAISRVAFNFSRGSLAHRARILYRKSRENIISLESFPPVNYIYRILREKIFNVCYFSREKIVLVVIVLSPREKT